MEETVIAVALVNVNKIMNLFEKVAITKIYVRYYETDRMKIVHHSNYFRYFELARCEFFTQKVVGYSILEDKYGVLSPLVSSSAKFFKPLKFEDYLYLLCFIRDFSVVKVIFEYLGILFVNFEIDKLEIDLKNLNLKKIKNLVCWGQTEHVFVDKDNFHPLRINKVFIEEKQENLANLLSKLVF